MSRLLVFGITLIALGVEPPGLSAERVMAVVVIAAVAMPLLDWSWARLARQMAEAAQGKEME